MRDVAHRRAEPEQPAVLEDEIDAATARGPDELPHPSSGADPKDGALAGTAEVIPIIEDRAAPSSLWDRSTRARVPAVGGPWVGGSGRCRSKLLGRSAVAQVLVRP